MYLIWFVFVRAVGNQGYVSRNFIYWKIFEQIGIGKVYLYVFFNDNDWNRYICRGVFRTLLGMYDGAPSLITGMVLNTPRSYRESIWYYNKEEYRAHASSGVQVKN